MNYGSLIYRLSVQLELSRFWLVNKVVDGMDVHVCVCVEWMRRVDSFVIKMEG